jgi:uncharacterized protein (DUF342 family)
MDGSTDDKEQKEKPVHPAVGRAVSEDNFDLDRGLKIEVSKDSLEAKLIAMPRWLVGRDITIADISLTLERFGIHQDRSDYSSMEKITNEINYVLRDKINLSTPLSFPIAKGIPPEEGINGWIKYSFPRARRVVIKEDGNADFRNIDRYIHVKKNDKLAVLFDGVPGKQGIDVFGKPVSPKPIERFKIKIGNNIREAQEPNPDIPTTILHVYYATSNGVIFTTDNSITVSPELNIDSDVGLETGNINYEGTINVTGSIVEGSNVFSKGSLYVGVNVESMDVVVQENLDVKGGIKGKDKAKGLIRVTGDVNAKFIENASLEVEGDVIVENNILNSNILCLGSIFITSDNGSIVSSNITVFKGLSTANLGSNAELDTKVEVGFHYKNNRLYQEGKEKFTVYEKEAIELEPKIFKIKEIVTRSRGKLDENKKVEFKAIFEDYAKRKQVIQLFTAKLENIKIERFNPDNVKVVIRNHAFPGTVIRYRKQIEKITKPQSSFILNFFPNQEKAIPVAWTKN